MNILFVIYGSIDQVSGGYLYDRKVIASLRENGESVDVFGLRKLPYIFAPLQSLSPRLRRLFRSAPRANYRNVRHYDLVVIDELVHPSLAFALPGKRDSVCRIVTLVHHLKISERGSPALKPIARLMEKRLLNRSDRIIVNSATTEMTVLALLRRAVPVRVCMPGRDTFAEEAYPREARSGGETQVVAAYPEGLASRRTAGKSAEGKNGPVRILSVGNLIPRKGHHRLLQVLTALKELNWTLTIVGSDAFDRRYARRIRAFVENHGLQSRVSVTGAVSSKELERLYGRSELFTIASDYEGFGIALAEALCFSLPYLAMESGALSEIVSLSGGNRGDTIGKGIRRMRGGFLVDRDLPAAFEDTLRLLIEREELRAALSEEAGELARLLPTWEETGRCFRSALG